MHSLRREQLKLILALQETGSDPFNLMKDGEENIAYQYTQKLHNVPGLSEREAERFRAHMPNQPGVEIETEFTPEDLETDEWAYTMLVDEPDLEIHIDIIEVIFEHVLDIEFEALSEVRGTVSGGEFEFTLIGEPSEEESSLDDLGIGNLITLLTDESEMTPSFINVELDDDDEVLTVETDFEPGQVAVGIGMNTVDFEPDRFPAVVYRTDSRPPIFTAFDGTVLCPEASEEAAAHVRRFFEQLRSPSLEIPDEVNIQRRTVADLR